MKKSFLSSLLLFLAALFSISSVSADGYWKVVWDNDVSEGSIDISEYAEINGDYDQSLAYYTAGPGNFNGTVTPSLQWMPNGSGQSPPSSVIVRLESSVICHYNVYYKNIAPPDDTSTMTHSLGGKIVNDIALPNNPPHPTYYDYNYMQRGVVAGGKKYLTVFTDGQPTVELEDITFSVSNASYPYVPSQNIEMDGASMDFLATVNVVNFSMLGLPEKLQTFVTYEATDKEINAFAKLNWRDVGMELPFEHYWEGKSSYSLTSPSYSHYGTHFVFPDNTDIPNNTETYQWTLQGNQTLVPPPDDATQQEIDESDINADTRNKNLIFDFGQDASLLPKSTTVLGLVTGANGGSSGSQNPVFTGKVKINWYGSWGPGVDMGNITAWRIIGQPGTKIPVPPYNDENDNPVVPPEKDIEDLQPGETVIIGGKERVVLDTQENSDGSITANYGIRMLSEYTEEDDLMAYIELLENTGDEVVIQGATYVKYGLESYKFAAEQMVYGPLTGLGATALITLGVKATDLAADAIRTRALAESVLALVSKARNAATLLRGKTGTPQEIAEWTAKANALDNRANGLSAHADDLYSAAAHYEHLGAGLQSEIGIIRAADDAIANGIAGTKGVLDVNSLPFTSGGSFSTSFNTPKGTIDLLTDTVIDGNRLILDGFCLYPANAQKLDVGSGGILAVKKEFLQMAKAWGFDEVQIVGVRYKDVTRNGITAREKVRDINILIPIN